eukprot:NODE_480_length_7860_cov_0.165958.p2 type:complete len:788 gc:universal NODE_480_length_7860_cov_0.165958:4845-7208(+)
MVSSTKTDLLKQLKLLKKSKKLSIDTVIELTSELNDLVPDHGLNSQELQLFLLHCTDCLTGNFDSDQKNLLIFQLMEKQLMALIDDCLSKNSLITSLVNYHVAQSDSIFNQNLHVLISFIFDELTFIDNSLISLLLDNPKCHPVLHKSKCIQFLFSYFTSIFSELDYSKIAFKINHVIAQYRSKWSSNFNSIYSMLYPIKSDLEFDLLDEKLYNFSRFIYDSPKSLLNCKSLLLDYIKSSSHHFRYAALLFFIVILNLNGPNMHPNDRIEQIFDQDFIRQVQNRIGDENSNIRKLSIFTFPYFYWFNFKALVMQLRSSHAEERILSVVMLNYIICKYLENPYKHADKVDQLSKISFFINSIGDRIVDRDFNVRKAAIDVICGLFSNATRLSESVQLLIMTKVANSFKINCPLTHAIADLFFNSLDPRYFILFLNGSTCVEWLLHHLSSIQKIRAKFMAQLDSPENSLFLSVFDSNAFANEYKTIHPWLLDVYNNIKVEHSIKMLNDMNIEFGAIAIHLSPLFSNHLSSVIKEDTSNCLLYAAVCNLDPVIVADREFNKTHLILLKRWFLIHDANEYQECSKDVLRLSNENNRLLSLVQVLCNKNDFASDKPSWLLAYSIKYKNNYDTLIKDYLHSCLDWINNYDTECVFKIIQYSIIKLQDDLNVFKPFIKLSFQLLQQEGVCDEITANPIELLVCSSRLLLKLSTISSIYKAMGIDLFHTMCLQVQASDYKVRSKYITLLCKLLKLGKLDTNYLSSLYLLAFEPDDDIKLKGQSILRLFSKRGNII